jgi:hypothetical protein
MRPPQRRAFSGCGTCPAWLRWPPPPSRPTTSSVRACLGRLSGLNVFHSKSVLFGVFVWARMALSGPGSRARGRWCRPRGRPRPPHGAHRARALEAFLRISPHFSAFLHISPHFSAFLHISPHFSAGALAAFESSLPRRPPAGAQVCSPPVPGPARAGVRGRLVPRRGAGGGLARLTVGRTAILLRAALLYTTTESPEWNRVACREE